MTRRMKDDPVHGLNTAIACLLTHRECPVNSPEATRLKSAVEWWIQNPLEGAAALIEEYMAANSPAKDTCSHCGRTNNGWKLLAGNSLAINAGGSLTIAGSR